MHQARPLPYAAWKSRSLRHGIPVSAIQCGSRWQRRPREHCQAQVLRLISGSEEVPRKNQATRSLVGECGRVRKRPQRCFRTLCSCSGLQRGVSQFLRELLQRFAWDRLPCVLDAFAAGALGGSAQHADLHVLQWLTTWARKTWRCERGSLPSTYRPAGASVCRRHWTRVTCARGHQSGLENSRGCCQSRAPAARPQTSRMPPGKNKPQQCDSDMGGEATLGRRWTHRRFFAACRRPRE